MLDVANGAWSETVTIIWRKQRKCRIVWDVTVVNSAGHIKNELKGLGTAVDRFLAIA